VLVLDEFDSLVADHLPELLEIGTIRYARSPKSSLKQRRSLLIQTDGADFEILLWESGEVELGWGTPEDLHQESIELSSDAELRDLVERFIEIGRSWGR
jgi:hypothetical protein